MATNNLRVLVVDDDPEVGDALAELLGVLGHTPALARDGGEAMVLAREFGPELVLCDLTLPGVDGFEVARALRADPQTADAHLVALTGHTEREVAIEALAAGFDQHLAKPLDLGVLESLLSGVQPG